MKSQIQGNRISIVFLSLLSNFLFFLFVWLEEGGTKEDLIAYFIVNV